MLEATGRHPDEWFAFLDAQGATAWEHRRIVDWLVEEAPGVSGWWCQAITVRYEQARGMRQAGQRADGTFEGSVTRSIPGDQQHALDLAIAAVQAVHGPPAKMNREAAYPSARWSVDGAALEIRVNPTKNGKSGVTLTSAKLPDAAALNSAKSRMSAMLESIPADTTE